MAVAKINPLEQLIAIYGKKFADALKAGDLTKAIRMCADYQNPDTGQTLPFEERLKAFAFRVSMEALKVPEIDRPAVTVHFTPEKLNWLLTNREIAIRAMDCNFYQTGTFDFMGVQMKLNRG